jgi:homoserine dehydrogenase
MRADLALVGFGNVGRRFAILLDERRERLSREEGLEVRVIGIATRRHGTAYASDGLDAVAAVAAVESGQSLSNWDGRPAGAPPSDSFETIARLARSSAPMRVLVETTTLDIVAGQPAIDHVRQAMTAGCHVITANKGPVAFAYETLSSEANRAGVQFLFEGAVMDGVPVFSLLRETLPELEVRGFRGIVNSTTNHVLTELEEGAEFGPALACMQDAGIAEADPSLDIDGWDAAAKTAALANVLFDARITPHDVDRQGIGPELSATARACVATGRRLRLVASGTRGERPCVRPVELPAHDLLAGMRGMANALILTTDLLGDIAICQLEGNPTQTAYALLSDLVTIRRRLRAPLPEPPRRSPSPREH